MGTRSSIAVKHVTRIKAVYCHWDGYLDHNGRILLAFYDSTKANNLVALGNISSLGADIGSKHSFDQTTEERNYFNLGPTSVSSETTFYGRDRGELNQEFRSFASEEEWISHMDGSGCEYFYLMDSGVWYVSEYGRDLVPLHEAIEESDLATKVEIKE